MATTKQLTIYNDTFHDHMTMASHPSFTKPHRKWKTRRREYNEFMSSPFTSPFPTPRYLQDRYGPDYPASYTSDDTKSIERDINSNPSTSVTQHNIKKHRSVDSYPSDSYSQIQVLNNLAFLYFCYFFFFYLCNESLT
ncbi:unnamed protein product [Rhizophagus irregularis]|nr:unnamed protein product [Rhizophagus irregularis]